MAHKTLRGRTCRVTASASKCLFHRGRSAVRRTRRSKGRIRRQSYRFSATSRRRGRYKGAKRGYRY